MQWPPRLFQEAAVQQRYMSCASPRSVGDGMMNDCRGEGGGWRKCSQGRFDMRASWDIHVLALFVSLFPFLSFCPYGWEFNRNESGHGRFEGLPPV